MSGRLTFGPRRRRWPVVALAAALLVAGALGAVVIGASWPWGAGQEATEDPADALAPPPGSAPGPGPTPSPEPATEEPAAGLALPAVAAPTPVDERVEVPADLAADVADLLDDEDLDEIDGLSALVTDAAGGEVAARGAERAVVPASTAKLVTAGAALHLLGPDYRYVTRAVAEAVDDGLVDGDLVVVGSGDPTLASPHYVDEVHPQRPHTPLADLAEAVADAGVERVAGDVVGDGGRLGDESVAEGWPDRYLDALDATRASGLTVDAGRALIERDDESIVGEAAEDPAATAAEVLVDLLDEAGVEVAGEPVAGSAPPGTEEVARVRSPPLSTLLAHVVQTSDNHMADALFLTLGAAAGEASWQGGEATARRALADLDLDWSRAELADGSGLSRQSRLSARFLVDLERGMTARHGEAWTDLLAVAGESGTLERRLRDTPADGRLAGKTGALRDARSLVAQVTAEDGERYHFAVLGDDLDWEGIAAVRELMDELSVRLAEG